MFASPTKGAISPSSYSGLHFADMSHQQGNDPLGSLALCTNIPLRRPRPLRIQQQMDIRRQQEKAPLGDPQTATHTAVQLRDNTSFTTPLSPSWDANASSFDMSSTTHVRKRKRRMTSESQLTVSTVDDQHNGNFVYRTAATVSVPDPLQSAANKAQPQNDKLLCCSSPQPTPSVPLRRPIPLRGATSNESHSAMVTSQASANTRRRSKAPCTQGTRVLAADTSRPLPIAPLKLPRPHLCQHCGAKKLAYETLHFCCGNGQIKLPSNEFPPELVRLYTSQEEDAQHFRKYARLYNNMFAYSSLGGKFDIQTQKGIYVFKLHGQIYHYISDLLPANEKPKYLQLYFYDGLHEKENRLGCFPELRQDVIDILMNISQRNPYAKFFRSLKELEINDTTKIIINRSAVADQSIYNAPTSDEVAVIWPESSSSSASDSPHITVSGKSNESHRIMHYYGCYDPLQYPLLFPHGESGWSQCIKKQTSVHATQLPTSQDHVMSCNIDTTDELLAAEAACASQRRQKTERHVSPREYYCYKLQSRPNNLMLRAGRCLQQYIVDMYVKVENTRLDYFRNHQDTVRAELYQGILDTLERGEHSAANVGRRVILPPTFIGGPRDMKKRYLNAMALVNKYGKPDLFVTMTCNANWPEIKRELAANEKAQDRPDVVSRVFRAKLLRLKKEIMQEHIFGEVDAMIYVVEFQKRGLPHAHFLLILKPPYKIKCSADFDKFVCAEIPPMSSSLLRQTVLKHLMHGPCGLANLECPCMKHQESKGRCKYGYPKTFSATTTTNSNGYPSYKRRDLGEKVLVRRHTKDNRWVIPYNPYLSALFDCHLNVEVCSTIQAVKYLYKYVYKGHDRISYNVVPNNKGSVIDEIEHYQSGRWVSPCEAAWRIFGFDLFEMHPAVMPLPVHLPNMQTLQVRPHEQLQNVISDKKRSRTPLTEFFRINTNTGGTELLYNEVTERYRWDASARTWCKRKKKLTVVGRPAFVAPAEGERFYLRLLLLHVRSPKSFEDLQTVDNKKCSTFQEAALKLRLLEEDDAVDLCLKEACEVQMPSALRRLFATVLIFCQPSDPNALWVKYYDEMSQDFRNKNPEYPNKVREFTVREVEKYLEDMGKSLKTFGLQHLSECQDEEIRRTRDIVDALDAPIPQECIDSREMLNQAQQEVFDMIMNHVREGKGGAFFIDGPGGTGKTFLYNALYAEVRLMNKIVLPTTTSGIAASNIPSGRTSHSRFKIPLDTETSLACDVPKQSSLAALIRESTLIIWDEASMARKENVESLDFLLRDLCESNIEFGGKLVVFGGDFRQVLPIVPRKSTRETVQASLVTSGLWSNMIKFRLTENIRAREDPEFAEFLLALGNGQLQTVEHGFVHLPSQIIRNVDSQTNPVEKIAELAYPELNSSAVDVAMFTQRAILTPMNDEVDAINAALIKKFPGPPAVYRSFDSIIDDTCNVYTPEFINQLCPGGMSPHELVLKPNCPVILLRNILPAFGLCNGTRLMCKRFFPNLIECMITVGHHKGQHVFIPRVNLRPSASSKYPFKFQRKQFPIKLSFAMTINKSQGQTLSQVVVYLPRPCFSPGQLYVALSRGRQAAQVTVVSTAPTKDDCKESVINIVSYEVLKLAGII